ncbi:fibrinogen-like protein 1 [Erpetoichthys calabaricus]|uniref:Fibrinogen-like protein 1 n=1 Tax=Erpetoichthys calabaricus TaxID=27687 RepID=A0A8C4RIM7_ERPCA|nr:fibrinogen-like protein 1 [Erpetoichthys calabaricus]
MKVIGAVVIVCFLDFCGSVPDDCQAEKERLQSQVRTLEDKILKQQAEIDQIRRDKANQIPGAETTDSFIDLGGRAQFTDCSQIFNDGNTKSGFYKIRPFQSTTDFTVYCDMTEGGGWTVIQQRADGSERFDRSWNEYKEGFGNQRSARGEFWLGNEKLHHLTKQRNYNLRINLADFEGEQRYAVYSDFKVGDEKSSYQLTFGSYTGTAGDSLSGSFHPEVQWWASHNGMKFSTYDRDNDRYEGNCAKEDTSGWWFNRCHSGNLNGYYYNGPYASKTDNGIVWYTWHGWWYSMKSVVMKIRPAEFESKA